MCKWLLLAFALLVAAPSLRSPVLGRSMEAGDAAIVRQVTPAIVDISTWKLRPATAPGESPRRVKTVGSGFIVDPSGIVVTNKHVIDGALGLTVIFSDGERASAKLLRAGVELDLALLKIDVGHPLASLKWGDSDALQVGDPVLAIGNALGIGTSVSAGIVSGLNRNLGDSPFDSYIQTDAAINHGNSGGPLVDRNGDVVGIDTSLGNPNPNGGFIGIGFAIPSNTAKFAVHLLLDPSNPKPGWLGFTLQDMTQELAQALGVPPQTRGAIISVVDPSGAASVASLRPGDVLTELDGMKLMDSRAFTWAIMTMPVGKLVHLAVWHDRREQDVTATIAELPNFMPGGGMISEKMAQVMMEKEPDLGVRFAAITDANRQEYGLDPTLTGALVMSVESDSEARDLGIVPGDVVTAAQAEPVSTPNDVQRAISAAHEQRLPYLAVLIRSKNSVRWLSLSIGGAGL